MTACVAAISVDRSRVERIVTASDTLISYGPYASADGTSVKMEGFHDNWAALMASEDISQCAPIILKVEDYLKGKAGTLREAISGFKRGYQQGLCDLATDRILGRFGMDMKEFRRNGSKQFPADQFSSITQEIRDVKIDCSFLIYGFDENGHPHIFAVEYPGVVSVMDKPGFWAIGSGSYSALGMLYSLGQSVDRPLDETIFNVVAAKFMAESPGAVGEHTYFFVKQNGTDICAHGAHLIPTMRTWWNEKGKPKQDQEVLRQIRQCNFNFYSSKKGDPVGQLSADVAAHAS